MYVYTYICIYYMCIYLYTSIDIYISIITINANGLMLQPKDTDWLNEYKNKTHIYAVYKKPTSDLKTHVD